MNVDIGVYVGGCIIRMQVCTVMLHFRARCYLNNRTGILQVRIIAVVVEPIISVRIRECP